MTKLNENISDSKAKAHFHPASPTRLQIHLERSFRFMNPKKMECKIKLFLKHVYILIEEIDKTQLKIEFSN